MTKIYQARPATPDPSPSIRSESGYMISPDAQVIRSKLPPKIEQPSGIMPQDRLRGTYLTQQGSHFTLELNLFDSRLQKPVRSAEVRVGLQKGFTDRIGRWIQTLPAGLNSVSIGGYGFVEKGGFSPQQVKFPKVNFNVDLDSDSTITVYVPEGAIVQGERHELGNPHNSSFDFPVFIEDNWKLIAMIGGAGVIAYWVGKSRLPSDSDK